MLTSGILNGCSDNKRICIEYREPGYFIEALARVVHQHLLPGFKILRNFTGKNDTFQKCLLTPSVSGERHDITALHTCLDLGWEAEKSTKSKREIATIISRYCTIQENMVSMKVIVTCFLAISYKWPYYILLLSHEINIMSTLKPLVKPLFDPEHLKVLAGPIFPLLHSLVGESSTVF